MKAHIFRPSLKRRVALCLVVACALVWLAVYLQGMYVTRKPETGYYDRDLVMLTRAVAAVAKQWPDPERVSLAMAGIDAFVDASNALADIPREYQVFYVWDVSGSLVFASQDAVAAHRGKFDAEGFSDQTIANENYRVFSQWTADGKYFVESTQRLTSRRSLFHGLMFSGESLNILLIGILLSLAPTLLVMKSGLRPLTVLVQELGARQPGDLRPLTSPANYLEIAPLVDEFNATLAQLSALLERERSFLSDAAHELRTPIAVVSAQVDNLLSATTQEERLLTTQRLQRGLVRASRLVNQLLALARLDANLELRPVPLDIADHIRDCMAGHAAAARERGIEMAYSGPEHALASVPMQALDSILDNLVGNAVRYGAADGTVEVTLIHIGVKVKIEVADNGPGIPPGDRSRLFQRFQRGTQLDASGSGLGLSIVTAAAAQMGATIDIQRGIHGQGICFCVEFEANPD